MIERPNKLQPALVGGLIIGLLSTIPVVSAGNFCCCMWVLLGGAIASRMLVKRSPYLPITTGEGAGVGALAGVVSSGIVLVIGVPINLLLSDSSAESLRQMSDMAGDPAYREAMLQVADFIGNSPLLFALIEWFIKTILFIVFATLGGIIGVAMFEKRKGPQAPPPPPPPQEFEGFAPPAPPAEPPPQTPPPVQY